MEEIAEDLAVSSEQLRRFFLVYVNRNFIQWRKSLRINEARVLLIDYPKAPIEQIGIMVGINDKANFRRQFMEETGMTPTQWRERHRHALVSRNRMKHLKEIFRLRHR